MARLVSRCPSTVCRWRIQPAGTPRLERPCPRCDARRPFESSDRFRVNANGRRLDAWLIYRCVRCGARWNQPVLERASVASVDRELLDRLFANDRELARRFAAPIHGSNVSVSVERPPHPRGPFSVELAVPQTVSLRLDRLLAAELGLSRRELARQVDEGRVRVVPGGKRSLRRALRDGTRVHVDAGVCATRAQRDGG